MPKKAKKVKIKKVKKPKVKKPIKPKVKTNEDMIKKEIKIQNLTEIGDMASARMSKAIRREGRDIVKDVGGLVFDYAWDYLMQ